jgi:ParB-like chromosome segregation protein Spo0J
VKKETIKQPVDTVVWVHRDELKPNNYNPNSVAPAELRLLKISIIEDGWTQPIVCNPDKTIVDGFHRWTVSASKDIYRLTGGLVPVVFISPQDVASQKMATIRHNRARGTHAVLAMAEIVESMLKDGLSAEEIETRLQMEREEVVRLANRKGIPKTDIVTNANWSPSWVPD